MCCVHILHMCHCNPFSVIMFMEDKDTSADKIKPKFPKAQVSCQLKGRQPQPIMWQLTQKQEGEDTSPEGQVPA